MIHWRQQAATIKSGNATNLRAVIQRWPITRAVNPSPTATQAVTLGEIAAIPATLSSAPANISAHSSLVNSKKRERETAGFSIDGMMVLRLPDERAIPAADARSPG